MSLLFRNIRWKNLLSTGNSWTDLDFLRNTSTMIMGDNGAGKSTLLDALSFVLYNKPFRRINKPQLINSVNQREMAVEIQFETAGREYKIVRGIKPAIFEIYQNGKLINQDAKARDYQDFLERDILKMNHKSFTQIVILGSSTFVPFMQLPAAQRRDVIEDLLDLQIFSRMNTLLKEKIQENKTAIREIEYQIDLTNEKVDMQKRHIQEFAKNNKAMVARKKERIAEATENVEKFQLKVEEVSKEIESFNEYLSDYDNVLAKRRSFVDMVSKLTSNQSKITKKQGFYKNTDNCPTCKQSIDEIFKETKIEEMGAKSAEIENAIKVLDSKTAALDEKISDFAEMQKKLYSKNTALSLLNQDIHFNNNMIKDLQKEIEEVSQIKPEDNIKEFKSEIETLGRRKTELNELHTTYRVGSEMLKDSGIKSQIIKQYIPVMNKMINHYLGQLGFFVQFELDENFNETITSRYLDVFSYDSFSEGEKLRIDLSLLFTWRQIARLRNSVSTNLLIMDEVFDSSLDANGTEEFLKILEGLTNDTNTFIISHKSEQLMEKFPAVIRFSKKGNFSIKEDV